MVRCYTSTSSTKRYRFKRIQCNGGHVQYPAQRWTLWQRLAPMLCHAHFGCQIQVYWCKDVIDQLMHLNTQQKADLLQVLMENAQMFDGTLSIYPHTKVHLELDPNAKLVHTTPNRVPCIHLSTFKKELDHLVALGVLIPQKESEWASPTFIIPKKDREVPWSVTFINLTNGSSTSNILYQS